VTEQLTVEQIRKLLLREARKDLFDRWGRINLDDFKKTYNVKVDEILKSLRTLPYQRRWWPPSLPLDERQLLLIKLRARLEEEE